MFAQLSKPRKKKRTVDPDGPPFPVPIASITNKPANNQHWFYYNAVLKDGCIYVTQEGDIHFLYKMGFFGKGMFSRGKPQHAKFISSFQGLQRKNLPPKERQFQQQRFKTVRKQRYERHLGWYKHLIKRKQTQTNSANEADGNDDENLVTEGGSKCENEPTKNRENKQKCLGHDCLLVSSSSDEDEDRLNEDGRVHEYSLDYRRDSYRIPAPDDEILGDEDSETSQYNKNSLDEPSKENAPRDEIDTVKMLKDTCTGGQTDQSSIDQSSSHELTDSQTSTLSSSCTQSEKNDRESSQVEAKLNKTKRKSNVLREDPYKVHEYLQLSLEEAFFLSYGLGCLVVKDENKELMNLTDMWKEYCSQQPNFLSNYIAYHYYRSKGWVPKTGVKFGAEFILYKKGPPFYHASYSVIIKMVDDGSLRSTNDAKERWSRWAGLNRVTETVAKEVLFCYVIKPTALTDQEMMSPKCISSFTVHEVVMKRIVPSRERTNPQLPPEIS